jgi:hypothetical protein
MVDAGFTPSYPTTGTDWYDLSGNGNYGTLTNGPTFDSGNGGSIVFDGSDDYVSVPNAGMETLLDGATSLSVSLWAYADAINSNGTTLLCWPIHDSSAVPPYTIFYLFLRNSDRAVQSSIGNGSTRVIGAHRTTNIQLGEWFEIGFVWSQSSGLTHFLNGEMLSGTDTMNLTLGTPGNNANLYIGTYNSNNSYWHNGKISNVKIYNRVLTSTEVLQNYNAQKGRFGL